TLRGPPLGEQAFSRLDQATWVGQLGPKQRGGSESKVGIAPIATRFGAGFVQSRDHRVERLTGYALDLSNDDVVEGKRLTVGIHVDEHLKGHVFAGVGRQRQIGQVEVRYPLSQLGYLRLDLALLLVISHVLGAYIRILR